MKSIALKQKISTMGENSLVFGDALKILKSIPDRSVDHCITDPPYNISGYEKHPAGQNIVVAIMSYKGYNMEDAIVLNKGSIERGMGRSTYYRPNIAEELRYAGGLVDEISIPDKDVKGYKSEKDYRFLEEDGIIYPEAQVKEGDVIIGKTSPPRFLSSLEEYNLAAGRRREAYSSKG